MNESWEVNVVLLLAADESGYSCKNVWTYREPYVDDRSTTPADAAAVTERAMSALPIASSASCKMTKGA